MKRYLLAIVVLAAAAPAMAADLPVRAAPPVVAPPPIVAYNSWSGFYIGGNLGGAWMQADETFINDLGFVDILGFTASSFIGGGHAGLQGQWGSFVLGIEGTFNWTDLNATVPSINPGGARTRSVGVDGIAAVVGKVGFTGGAGAPWMFYVKGGWAALRVNTSSTAPGITSDVTEWESGWTVGTGFDYMFARNWIAGFDFNYYTTSFDRAQPFTNGGIGSVAASRADIYAAQGRLTYLFNFARY